MKKVGLRFLHAHWIGAVGSLSDNFYYLIDGTLITDKDEFFDPDSETSGNDKWCLSLLVHNHDVKNYIVYLYPLLCSEIRWGCFCEKLN